MTRSSPNDDERRRIGYPRPLLYREPWFPLNGEWDFALDPHARWRRPDEVSWTHKIVVPFAPETTASGVHETGFFQAVWYRRTFEPPPLRRGQRLMLHFGSVDYEATVWINGRRAGTHRGGYTPFRFDITALLAGRGPQTLAVRAFDDPQDLTQPRGKQDWQLEPHSIWYPRTTGIWQTVWMEIVPENAIDSLRWIPHSYGWQFELDLRVDGRPRDDLSVRVRLESEGQLLACDSYTVIASEVHRQIGLSDPGIEDYRNELLWSPEWPTLIEAQLELVDARGRVLDSVRSYTALRGITVQGDRFVLNGRPLPLRMILDQGLWPDTGLTPRDDEAVRRDVELIKQMGFNGVRVHQRLPDPRYLYWADRLGLMVWEEMPSAYRFSKRAVTRLIREWTEAIERDLSHPCIVAWVPLNESWGVPDLPDSSAQRHLVRTLYYLTKTLDPTRAVIGNDGWESVATDIIGIHDYEPNPRRLLERYGAPDLSLAALAERERPGGRLLVLEPETHGTKPIVLSEFGGIACAPGAAEGQTWGYSRVSTVEELADRYAALVVAVRHLHLLAGFCYTQFTDTYQEANGLLFADRTPKFPIEEIALYTSSPGRDRLGQIEPKWRERLMQLQLEVHRVPVDDVRLPT